MKIWVSAIIPTQGAEIYNGVRLSASRSQRELYEDLAEWLEDEGDFKALGDDQLVITVSDLMDTSVDVRAWNVEVMEV